MTDRAASSEAPDPHRLGPGGGAKRAQAGQLSSRQGRIHLDAHQRQALETLAGDRAALLVHQPFVALLALRLELVSVSSPGLEPGATDGQRLLFDTRFVLGAKVAERRYLMAHLAWHAALLHPWRRPAGCDLAFDCALDHEVNTLLEPFVDWPKGTPWFGQMCGRSVEDVAAWLRRRPEPIDRGPLADVHLDATRGADWSWGASECPSAPSDLRAAQAMQLERFIGAVQQLRARGLQPPPLVESVLAEHRSANPPWRYLLAEFLSSVLGDRRRWIPPNRRHLHRGMYLPCRRVETLRLVVAIDTSLSTREHQDDFWSAVLSLLRSYDDCELLVIECDDRVRTVRTFTSNAPPDPSELVVSGLEGTDFRPVFEWVAARPVLPRAALVLTDGRGPAPLTAPPYPTLWVLAADGQRPAGWGRAVRLPARDTSRSGRS